MELKPLPTHLKYLFLGDNYTLPIIVSATLDVNQEDKLVHNLEQHKQSIALSIAKIRGIGPSFCMYKIKLEDEGKQSIEKQRRLNEKMKEVVQKEIIKWLDAGIIYPYVDNNWVSPVQWFQKNVALLWLATIKTN